MDVASWVWAAIGDVVSRGAEIAQQALSPLIAAFNAVKQAVEDVMGVIQTAVSGLADFFTSAGKIPGGANALKNLGQPSFTGGVPVFGSAGQGAIPQHSSFASGGRPRVGFPALVGENGPELFWPDRAGTIIPNGSWNQWEGGSGGDVEALVDAATRETNRRLAAIERNQRGTIDVMPSRSGARRR